MKPIIVFQACMRRALPQTFQRNFYSSWFCSNFWQ